MKIPDDIAVASIIGMGYPAERVPPYGDRDFRLDKLRYNGYAAPYSLGNRG